MMMNRRAMLTYSMASVALTLTGCKKANTTIIVINKTNLPLPGSEDEIEVEPTSFGVDASASANSKTYRFRKNRIKVGKSAKQKYVVKANKGDVAPLEGVLNIPANSDPAEVVDLAEFNLQVVVGYTNTYVVYSGGVVQVSPDL